MGEFWPQSPMHRMTSLNHAPLVIDIAGTTLTEVDRQRLAHPLVGGMILFGRNWQDRAQLTALCADIHALRPDLLICVDHEGGRVQRFRSDGFTHLPPMRTLGQLWTQDSPQRAMQAALACGYVLAAELRACGVDLSFTPVLDLDWGESSVIGDRSFDRDPKVVTSLAQSLMHGLLQAGMAHCGKHFPGHGFVQADSHVDVPVDTRCLQDILAEDAAPYPWLASVLASVMPAHIIYPQVDSRPAGFSPRWLQGILRAQLGFEGVIFSDDLSMEGARFIDGAQVSYTEAALAALHAGCDMVLLCNQSVGDGQPVDGLIAGLQAARDSGQWQPQAASAQRIVRLLPAQPAPDWQALQQDAFYQRARALLPQ